MTQTFWEPFLHPEKFRERLEFGKDFRSNVEEKKASMWKNMDSKIKVSRTQPCLPHGRDCCTSFVNPQDHKNFDAEFESRMKDFEKKQAAKGGASQQ